MKNIVTVFIALIVVTGGPPLVTAEEKKPAEAVQKITPGQVIVPYKRMRRIWGELLTLDLETRTGTFRAEHNDEVFRFTAMPYAEMLHHATFGDLSDFKIGERAIFRMHENEAGEWVWLTYIQDEMNMLNGHKEYYFVDAIDAEARSLAFTWAKGDKSFVRETGLTLQTDENTKFWKGGEPATFADINIGDKLRAKTRGTGQGKGRIAWHVFLDDESLTKFQAEQITVHTKKMTEEGLPGYVDRVAGNELDLTLFQEATVLALETEPGQKIRVAPAGVHRKPTGDAVSGKLVSCDRERKIFRVKVMLDAPASGFRITELARLWVRCE
tara:strand:- start:598 stop:1578 length:981 start_codon:yes stop_codon:yes gene_type:complete